MLKLLDKSVVQLHVTVVFYLENSRKIHPQGVEGMPTQRCKEKRVWESGSALGSGVLEGGMVVGREAPGPWAPLFISYFLPPGLVLRKLG